MQLSECVKKLDTATMTQRVIAASRNSVDFIAPSEMHKTACDEVQTCGCPELNGGESSFTCRPFAKYKLYFYRRPIGRSNVVVFCSGGG